jgi:hypothetical protein
LTDQNAGGGFLEIEGGSEGVDVFDLPPCTSFVVWTVNSRYRVVSMHRPEVCIQGGVCFPEPTAARLVGSSSVPGGPLRVGWIGIGFRIELRSRDHYVVTSPVRAIAVAAHQSRGLMRESFLAEDLIRPQRRPYTLSEAEVARLREREHARDNQK